MKDMFLSMNKKAPLVFLWGLAFIMVVLAIYGGISAYTPIPFWDMWYGYIGFFLRVSDGDWAAWWSQHNEHRIVLSRILFWMDIRWFHGNSLFLIVMNYLLVGASTLVFWKVFRYSVRNKKITLREVLIGFSLMSWLFLWCQSENLTWAFQSQFILAQLLPLCALYWLHKSAEEAGKKSIFVIACCFGFLSAGAMANGIMTLPLMVVFSILARLGLPRIFTLLLLSLLMLSLYFHGYDIPANHGSLLRAVMETPLDLMKYVLLYLGGPFYYLSGGGPVGYWVGYFAGFSLVACSVFHALKIYKNAHNNTLQLALLFFILYIGGTALGTAGGRLIFGVNQALSSRYSTPSIMAWASLALLYFNHLGRGEKAEKLLLCTMLILAPFMLVYQMNVFKHDADLQFEQKISVLALELQIKDSEQIKKIYEHVDLTLEYSKKASASNISIFGISPFVDVKEQFMKPVPIDPVRSTCLGSIDALAPVPGEKDYVRVSGWVFDPGGKKQPQIVRFVNSKNEMVGYALTGQVRPDLVGAINSHARNAGFRGYLLASQVTNTSLAVLGANPACVMQPKMPKVNF